MVLLPNKHMSVCCLGAGLINARASPPKPAPLLVRTEVGKAACLIGNPGYWKSFRQSFMFSAWVPVTQAESLMQTGHAMP